MMVFDIIYGLLTIFNLCRNGADDYQPPYKLCEHWGALQCSWVKKIFKAYKIWEL